MCCVSFFLSYFLLVRAVWSELIILRVVLYRDQSQLAELKLKHNKECKGLFIRIRYLNAKFARETTFREDLKYQKNYLLALLAQSERGCVYMHFPLSVSTNVVHVNDYREHRILAAIARIGFPIPTPSSYTPPKSRLKSAVFSLIFIQRITYAFFIVPFLDIH